jgi:DNA-binding transcriptional ArsR family regulator
MGRMPPRDYWSGHDPIPEEVDLSVEVFGNRFNIDIVRFLAHVDRAQLSDLLEGTGIQRGTLSLHLKELEQVGVIVGDLAPDRRRGKSVNYSLDKARLEELFRAHMQFLLNTPPSQ